MAKSCCKWPVEDYFLCVSIRQPGRLQVTVTRESGLREKVLHRRRMGLVPFASAIIQNESPRSPNPNPHGSRLPPVDCSDFFSSHVSNCKQRYD